jgi:microcystin-dependent protein
MRQNRADPAPLSSFPFPIEPPASDPDAGDLIHICFALAWRPMVLGCLQQLFLQSTWKTSDPDVLQLAQSRADQLMYLFTQECPAVPIGAVIEFAAASLPDGYLWCDGLAVSRATYAALFAVIGTIWGNGDGETTFNVPDRRSRSAIGAGQAPGLSAWTLADTGGEETHTLTTAEMPIHSHSAGGHVHTTHSHLPGLAVTPGELPVSVPGLVPDVTSSSADSIGNAGGDGAHNTLHPVVAMKYAIKY